MRFAHTVVAFAALGAGMALSLPTDTQAPFLVHEDATHDTGRGVHTLPQGMKHRSLSTSGPIDNRLNLVFFGDGYTLEEEDKFYKDAHALTQDIIKPNASYGPISALLNVHAVFVPSNESGIGSHGETKDTPFGLYRPGSELRGVFYSHRKRVIEACKYWREQGKGCDEPILLGNDPLYGGLGGTPTVITASKVNGPFILRHELGHTLIPAGEEYDGGQVYDGANSALRSALKHGLSWKHWLSRPAQKLRIEDSRTPLQAYTWHDLTAKSYRVRFNASEGDYPTAMLHFSISGLPYEDHVDVRLNNVPVEFSIPPYSRGGNDRAWVRVNMAQGLQEYGNRSQEYQFDVRLTKKGRNAEETQGGKMLTSVQIIEYGSEDKFNKTEGFIGAFPTYDENGNVTLRPTDEACLMREMTYPHFCPVCLESLYLSTLGRMDLIDQVTISCDKGSGHGSVSTTVIDLPDANTTYTWKYQDQVLSEQGPKLRLVNGTGWYQVSLDVKVPEIRLVDDRLRANRTIWFGGC